MAWMTASVAVFRAIGRCWSDKGGQPGSELSSATVRRVTDSDGADRSLGDPAHRDDVAPRGELLEERPGRLDLGAVRPAVRVGLSGAVRVGRHDVPEEHVLGQVELLEYAVDDRRRRLGRAAPGQLPLRRKG